MTLEKYALVLDRILFNEAGWVTAERGLIKVFIKKPVWKETARNVYSWVGSGGQYPVLTAKFKEGDLDLEEYKDRFGKIDWSACRVQI
jgi:hypothetical protein